MSLTHLRRPPLVRQAMIRGEPVVVQIYSDGGDVWLELRRKRKHKGFRVRLSEVFQLSASGLPLEQLQLFDRRG